MRIFALLALMVVGCTPDISEKNINLSEPVEESNEQKAVVASQEQREIINDKKVKPAQNVEVFRCPVKNSKGWVIAVNSDTQAFKAGACVGAEVQIFLGAGYSVVAMNRPGFGASTPAVDDFGGPSSQQAVLTTAAHTSGLIGVWGVGTGAIAAAFASKKLPKLPWIILGNLFSDLEQFEASPGNSAYKSRMKKAMAQARDPNFHEYRSIAWDTSNLPKRILLYHTKGNTDIPVVQARALRDRLAAEERQVSLEEIDGAGNDLTSAQHRQVLRIVIGKI